MLKLSTKGRYGVRAMFEIAKGYPSEPVTIKEISEKQAISVSYLEQILNKLRNAGFIKSIKGPGGGYVLSIKPVNISIGEIIKVFEGPVAIASCLDPQKGCMRVDKCVTYLLWRSLGDKVEAFLNTVTLKDLLKGTFTQKRPKIKARGK